MWALALSHIPSASLFLMKVQSNSRFTRQWNQANSKISTEGFELSLQCTTVTQHSPLKFTGRNSVADESKISPVWPIIKHGSWPSLCLHLWLPKGKYIFYIRPLWMFFPPESLWSCSLLYENSCNTGSSATIWVLIDKTFQTYFIGPLWLQSSYSQEAPGNQTGIEFLLSQNYTFFLSEDNIWVIAHLFTGELITNMTL